MENVLIMATPWYIVAAVALTPTFILLIADTIGWALRRISWGRQREVGRGRRGGATTLARSNPAFQTRPAASSRIAAVRAPARISSAPE